MISGLFFSTKLYICFLNRTFFWREKLICEIFFPRFLMIYTHRIFFSNKKNYWNTCGHLYPHFFMEFRRKLFTLHIFFCVLALCLRDQDIFNSFFLLFFCSSSQRVWSSSIFTKCRTWKPNSTPMSSTQRHSKSKGKNFYFYNQSSML